MRKNSVEIKSAITNAQNRWKEIIETCKSEVREMTEDEEKEIEDLKAEIEKKKSELQELEEELKNYDDKLPAEEEVKAGGEKEKEKEEINNRKNMKTFNITAAIRAKVNGTPLDNDFRSRIEATTKEMRSQGLDVNGFAIPFDLREATNVTGPITGNELNATLTETQGKSTIHEDYQSILAPVFNANVLSAFDSLTGLKGTVEIPRYGGVGAGWKGELTKADETSMKFDGVTASPKRLTSYVVISKQLLMQSDYNVEQFVRQEIVNAITRKLQETVLGDQAGTTTKPAGLFYNADKSYNAWTFANLVAIEKDAEKANVTGNLGYVINPDIKATLRTTLKSEVAGAQYLYENEEILGQNTIVSNDAKGLLFGDLKSIVLCSWGNGIDMVIDPYTLADYDAIKITVNSYWDVINRAPLTGEGAAAQAQKTVKAYVLGV